MPAPSASDFDRLRALVAIADVDARQTRTIDEVFTGKALSPASTEVLVQIMERCRTCSARLRGSLRLILASSARKAGWTSGLR